MAEQFGDNFITITDEEGKEFELEVLATAEYQSSLYFALVPADSDDSDELEVSILKQVNEDGEDILVTVDDEDELEAVYEILMEELDDEGSEEP